MAPTEEINFLKVLSLCPVAGNGYRQRHLVGTYSARSFWWIVALIRWFAYLSIGKASS